MNEKTGQLVKCLCCENTVKDTDLDEYLQCQECHAEMMVYEPVFIDEE